MTARALYLYAVVPSGARLDGIRGVSDEPVEVVWHAQLGVAVGDALVEALAAVTAESADAAALGELARRHDVVVRAAMATTRGVLPFRLGTALRDRDDVRRYLSERADALHAGLRHVAECQEWGVTVRDDGGVEGASAAPADPGPITGTAFLARRRQEVAAANQRRRARHYASSDVAAELRMRSVDAVAGRQRSDEIVLDESYLVRRDAEPAFVDAVDRCGDRLLEQGLFLQLTGPWPPYSFAGAAREAGDG
ncbi:MAG: GvpL/GvpF family gas vesicle protein [Kofleriaceae bacterium]